MATSQTADVTHTATELREVLGGLVRRLRAEHAVPLAQAGVMGKLDREGPATTSELAQAQNVRPQSMAQTVGDMEGAGLVSRRPDPTDGRRIFIELTKAGNAELKGLRADREGWLARAIEEELSVGERRKLDEAIELIARISRFELDKTR